MFVGQSSAVDQPSTIDQQSTVDQPLTVDQPSTVDQQSTVDQPSTVDTYFQKVATKLELSWVDSLVTVELSWVEVACSTYCYKLPQLNSTIIDFIIDIIINYNKVNNNTYPD